MIGLIWLCIMAYLVGSIPTGKIIARYKGIDIQRVGTGNIGASNAYKVLGFRYGLLVLLGDLGKAYLFIYIAYLFDYQMADLMLIGLCLLVGNTKSIFLDFTGGKGIATSLGVFLATEPYVAFILLFFWLIALVQTKLMELAGIAGLISIPFTYYRLEYDYSTVFISFIMCLLILLRHKSNFALKHHNESQEEPQMRSSR